jgi:TonB family protein
VERAIRAADRNDGRYRNALRAGLAISLALHAALLFAWRTVPPADGASVAAGPRSGDPVAAAGGGAMRALALADLRPVEIPSPPKPIPVLDAPDVDVSVSRERLSSGVSLARPGGQSAGLAGATGRGDGGADAEGRYRNTVPEPRVIIPDWDAPAEVKGMQVRLRVLVDERGRAVDVELDPRTPDEKFNRRLIESAMAMEFKPALRNGRPVRDWAVITRVF